MSRGGLRLMKSTVLDIRELDKTANGLTPWLEDSRKKKQMSLTDITVVIVRLPRDDSDGMKYGGLSLLQLFNCPDLQNPSCSNTSFAKFLDFVHDNTSYDPEQDDQIIVFHLDHWGEDAHRRHIMSTEEDFRVAIIRLHPRRGENKTIQFQIHHSAAQAPQTPSQPNQQALTPFPIRLRDNPDQRQETTPEINDNEGVFNTSLAPSTTTASNK